VTERNGFPPDDDEEDDYCNAADAKGRPFPTSIRDLNRTIDNGHDIDWTAFRVPGPLATLVRFRTAAASASTVDTLTDIDLYVLTVPGGGASATLDEVGRGITVGSTEDFTLLLSPGEYYAVVVDYAGIPTPYAICVATCANPFPGAAGGPETSPPIEQEATLKAKSRSTSGAARLRPGTVRRNGP
jgi:hypothetical protein